MTTQPQSGWARLPHYAVYHYWHAPKGTVQLAACEAPSLRLIAAAQFAPRDQIEAAQQCPQCASFLDTAASLLTNVAQRLQRGETMPRCGRQTAALAAQPLLILLCLLLSGCREPQTVPVATQTPTPRNLVQATPTATPPCVHDLAPKLRDKLQQGRVNELPLAAQQQIERARPCASPTASVAPLPARPRVHTGSEQPGNPPPDGGAP